MQASVTLRTWASSLAWATLVWGGSITACSGEAELTTELPEGAPSDLLAPGDSANTDASGSAPADSGDNAATRPDGDDSAAGANGSSPSAGPGRDGASPVVSLATLDVPSGEYCAAVSAWDPAWVQFEEEVLLLVNEERAQPADCGEDGKFAATGPVVMDPILRCSARLHSLDMFERGFFDHINPDGLDPFERMGAAGFHGSGAGENIAVGQTSPQQVMRSWMESDGHCANVMRPSYTMLGVGYHPGAGGRGLGSNFWTQNFGAPRCGRNCR
jgi:uncharacterized protein YkwD